MSRRWVAVFFAALLALGLATCAQYGRPWDEGDEQAILRENLMEYAARLGDSEAVRYYDALGVTRISESVERDHGQCAYYPVAWLVTADSLDEGARMALWHGYTWLIFTLGAFALYAVSRRLGLPRWLACAAALLLALSPRFFAEGHYNNKDIALLTLTLCTLWTALRVGEKPTIWRALAFALTGAACANTKIVGAAVWGLCGLLALALCLARRRSNDREPLVGPILAAALGFLAFYALLTPALWAGPVDFFRYLVGNATDFSRWQHYVLFRGEVIWLKNQPLPRVYLPWMILITTPLWALALTALGQASTLGRLLRAPRKALRDPKCLAALAATLLWLCPLAYAVLTRTRVYNGWRHFYFVYGPMLVLAAVGMNDLRRAAVSARRWLRRLARAASALLAALMLVTATGIAANHPLQYAYYNGLAHDDAKAGQYELDYWNVSALQTLEELCQAVPEGGLTVAGADLWSQTGLESAAPLLSDADRARVRITAADTADYVLSNPTYAVFSGWTADAPPVVRTVGYGCTLMAVYRHSAIAR